METKEPIRPLCLEFEDAKNEAFTAINNIIQKHRLPLSFMESILTEALYQVKDGARTELAAAERMYQQQLAEAAAENKQQEGD